MRAFRILIASAGLVLATAAAAAIPETPSPAHASAPEPSLAPALSGPSLGARRAEPRPWARSEKALLWGYMGLNAIDAWQTGNMPDGFDEGNPLFRAVVGDRPGAAETMALKSLAAYGIVHVTDRFVQGRTQRKVVLGLVVALQLFVVARNEQATGGIVFR